MIAGGIFFVLIAMFLYTHFQYIAYAWKLLRYGEFYLLSKIPDGIQKIISADFSGAFDFLQKTKSSHLLPETISSFDQHFAKYYSWIPALIIVLIGLKLMRGDVHTRSFKMDSLLELMKDVFPYNARFINYDPVNSPVNYSRKNHKSHATALSISPESFALMNPPLGLEAKSKVNELFRMPIWDGKKDFDTNLAELSFIAQFGEPYYGIDKFNDAEAMTYKFLLPSINPNEDESKQLIQSMIEAIFKIKSIKKLNEKELSPSGAFIYSQIKEHVEKAISKSKKHKKDIYLKLSGDDSIEKLYRRKDIFNAFKVIESEFIFSCHSHVRIGLMTMLQKARLTGVVNPMHINILKDMDRTLWYCLITVGREDVSFVECAGCYSHWVIEKELGAPIPHPEVTEAVNGLYKALKLDLNDE
jgi:hypothetical protein